MRNNRVLRSVLAAATLATLSALSLVSVAAACTTGGGFPRF